MLVLSRKINETILIGDDVRITLLDVEGDKVKIGIEAPKAMKIFREELLEATRSTNKQALAAPVISFGLSRIREAEAKAEAAAGTKPEEK
jgi:carbon storage regulator